MTILTCTGGVAGTNCFVLADEEAKEAVLFDAPDHTVEPLLDQVASRGWNLIGLWLTHGHFDHFADHEAVTRRFPAAKVLLHPGDALKAGRPELQTRLFGLPFRIPPLTAFESVTDGQKLKIGKWEGTALHTPGHAPGHVAYYFPAAKLLVGGDLIIGGSIGRTDFPDSNPAEMKASLRRVMALPDETRLLGGHGEETTLGEERLNNPFLGRWMA